MSVAPNGHGRSNGQFGDRASPGPPPAHARSNSAFNLGGRNPSFVGGLSRTGSVRNSTPAGTFAPKFIQNEQIAGAEERVGGIEGENDLSGKKYVWLRDPQLAFVRGYVVEELPNEVLRVQCDDGSQREVSVDDVEKVNPAKFDKANDMAGLTHLNEPSVLHNLNQRYQSDLIYTYSGLFLVAVNPYMQIPIYGRDYINMYIGRGLEETKPHIFAMADKAFTSLTTEGGNQSILVTGESGAGKTENTKKVIQYLAEVAKQTPSKQHSNLSEQILRANPILEAFGNAQTVRNNNSSRFGKFIRIQFTRSGQIAGAFIDWYLLEKSRVVHANPRERSYHIFYQLLRGADQTTRRELLLNNMNVGDFEYTKYGNDHIAGISDADEWAQLLDAFNIMGFTKADQTAILQTMAAVLHLSNVQVVKESLRADQAALAPQAEIAVQDACRLLGIDADAFTKALLHPRVKAGHELVEKVQTPEQVRFSLEALAKGIYERGFGDLVNRINRQLDRTSSVSIAEETSFIGVLDIAGFEIFEQNSFEQLCINYTNEKLQQFFNHHMFVLEQDEYAREQIQWNFIDFGKDLQPTIDLIEVTNPVGIFSCLDEDSVMPKATDKTFTEKLHSLWEGKSPKYKRNLLTQGFMLTHYASTVEYSTEGWLEKNKDPLNDNVTKLLASSSNKHIANLFSDCAEVDESMEGASRSRTKKGLFRTVAQRHKEQLSTLMSQLHSTKPHFVRCILPNNNKRPKQFVGPLVLDQLRCNGVLEGIRIARNGYPNRLPFAEFRARYEVLCKNMLKSGMDGRMACQMMLQQLNLDESWYRVGISKVFFRAGVLADLEERRDAMIRAIFERFASVARGWVQRRMFKKRQHRAEATRIIQHNFQVYLEMQANPWWRLFVRMRPLLGATRQSNEAKKREEEMKKLQEKMQADHVKAEEERRRAEAEIQRVQQTLESERALALDKEEIFRRLQHREADLTEKLRGAIEDQEALEGQVDELFAARKEADRLEKAGNIKHELNGRIAELEALLEERTEQEERLQGEIRMLQSQLSLKERKLQDLETKLLDNENELDAKLAHIRELQMTDLSATSTSFEDLAILKTDLRRFQDDRQRFEEEKQTLTAERDSMEAYQSQLEKAEREAADARRALEEQSSANEQLHEIKGELRERQSRDDVKRIAQADLNESKVTIEKEMYVQSDLTRNATAARLRAEKDRKEFQAELQALRKKFIELQEAKIDCEAAVERTVLQQANERHAVTRQHIELEKTQLSNKVQELKTLIANSENFKLHHDQEKVRLERELVTIKGRLTASENDNRALLNKVQQKNLDIARSNSRLTAEKTKSEEELNEAQLTIASLEKKAERLKMEAEDLKYELDREHKATSTSMTQLAERQMRTKAEATARETRSMLTSREAELNEAHENLRLLQKVFDPEAGKVSFKQKPDMTQTIDLAKKLEATEEALALANERLAHAQSERAQLPEGNVKRVLLEEMNSSQVNARSSPSNQRREWMRASTPVNVTPIAQRHLSKASTSSAKSDRTEDIMAYHQRMDLAAELEQAQNQLQMSEMRNKHLQAQIERSSPTKGFGDDDSSSMRRMQKLERENGRLHDMLDDSSKKVSQLEQSVRTGQLSLKEVQTKSHEELFDLIGSQEDSRRTLLAAHNSAVAELADAKVAFDEVKQNSIANEVELRDARSELEELYYEREQETAKHAQLLEEFSDLQLRLDTESSKLVDATHSLNLYKARADEYFAKLETAEVHVLKAKKAEEFAKAQAKETEEQCAQVMAERKQMDAQLEDLQRMVQQYEERVADLTDDLDGALSNKKRLQNELEDYRSQRAMDIEDKESSLEQTRKKYQSELASLTNELEIERDNVIHARGENSRLRDELEELRCKWDDEVLNSSSWAKEKSRLEVAVQGLSDSRDEAVNAHNEAQMRNLRSNVDDVAAERDELIKQKKGLEARLKEAAERLENVSSSPSKRDAALVDREVLALKTQLAEKEDITTAAVGKMRRAEALAQEVQKDLAQSRDDSAQLHKDKAALEKTVKDLQLKCIELETKGYSSASNDVRFLHGRIQELETNLEALEKTRASEARSVRNVDRTVKDLEAQLERRDKSAQLMTEDLNKARNKISRLLENIDELHAADSETQLAVKRAERELREEREKSLRLEREVDTLRTAAQERERSVRRAGTLAALSDNGGGSRRGSSIGLGSVNGDVTIEVPPRKSSLSKGFL
ncbi:hypothetical protein K470DRAFT_301469 [Piedraia hortae CBS 480.64]|uniref:Uncharacterized protein n=1 Tax=Piedraia hortae CBS 480.64 TaxID=1314780 RepID=A0A6A7BPE3_9PEZI|nr:hypothetical protein K470DRAFT_301469 [Piedraia hortae CBS 480.64]